MFEESEPGKPRDWGWSICIIITITIFNISIFIFMRAMLDMKDEFDEPVIQGDMRENLTKLLGFFALTYCFGCWCCFCCGGQCMNWGNLCSNSSGKNKTEQQGFTNCWQNLVRHKIVYPISLKNRFKSTSMVELGSGDSQVTFKDQSIETDECVLYDAIQQKAQLPLRKASMPTRPASLYPMPDGRQKVHWSRSPTETDRRGSLQPIQNAGAVALEIKQKMAVRGVDFVQVPVQMITPSTVGLLDKCYVNRAFTTDSPSTSTPTVSEEK